MAVRFLLCGNYRESVCQGGGTVPRSKPQSFFARTHRGETLSETRVMDLFRELFFEAEPIRRTAKAIFYEAQLSFDAGLN